MGTSDTGRVMHECDETQASSIAHFAHPHDTTSATVLTSIDCFPRSRDCTPRHADANIHPESCFPYSVSLSEAGKQSADTSTSRSGSPGKLGGPRGVNPAVRRAGKFVQKYLRDNLKLLGALGILCLFLATFAPGYLALRWEGRPSRRTLLLDPILGFSSKASEGRMDGDARGVAGNQPDGVRIPEDFDWQSYLWWNYDLRHANITTQAGAEAHYLGSGYAEARLYKPVNITLRYTACGGLFNQHYSHIAALTLAVKLKADSVIWPPMQERASFANRFHPDPSRNAQSWQYLDAESVWDLPAIAADFKEQFNVTVVKHAADCRMPNMTQPETAFQYCPDQEAQLARSHDLMISYGHVYMRAHHPATLAIGVQSVIRQHARALKHHPTRVLVDLPCTFFSIDTRGCGLVEDVARAMHWAGNILRLADKVIKGIARDTGSEVFNGIHLRMEKDAADWVRILGGNNKYWEQYKDVMRRAGLTTERRPLYIASGLLKSSHEDAWSQSEMTRLSKDIIQNKFATRIEFKEKHLTVEDLKPIRNEQSGLIDFLVLQQSWAAVGIGLSTFSFYLQESRFMDGRDPRDMEMLMLPFIGTDELMFRSAVVAIRTREHLAAQHRLRDSCKRQDGKPCFSKLPMGERIRA